MARHLDLMRDTGDRLPAVDDPASYTSARIWHCKYETLQPIGTFANLTSLSIATYPDASLDLLMPLIHLNELRITHLPKVASLEALRELVKLRILSLATLPSWDSSGKLTVVDSLSSIASLPRLEELELFGVVTVSRSADELLTSKSLKRVTLSKFDGASEARIARVYAA